MYTTMAFVKRRLLQLRKELRGFSFSFADFSSVVCKEAQDEPQPSFQWQLASHQEILDYLDRQDSQVSLDCYVSVLHRCIYSYSLGDGKRIHNHIMARNLQHHKLIGRLLVQLYARCGALHHALALFEGMSRVDTSLWNIMIKENIKHGKRKEAISLYVRMCEAGIQPDQASFTAMLSAHAKPDDLDGGKLIHSLIVEKGLDTDTVVATALVTMYGKCDDLQSALNVSERIIDQDLVAWNAQIVVHCEQEKGAFALRLFWQMLYEGCGLLECNYCNSC